MVPIHILAILASLPVFVGDIVDGCAVIARYDELSSDDVWGAVQSYLVGEPESLRGLGFIAPLEHDSNFNKLLSQRWAVVVVEMVNVLEPES